MVGNMSSTQDFFAAIREAGTMQRLVYLLEAGPHSRVTEIAAKTLANLAVHDSNQTAIRLSGGIPPLMRLLTLKPTDQARNPGRSNRHSLMENTPSDVCLERRRMNMFEPAKPVF